MGNNCAGARDNAVHGFKSGYNSAKNRAQGFKPQYVDDTGPTGCITKFQLGLPFSKITLNEYERRLKKLIDKEHGDEIEIKQIVECFKDHIAFTDIEDENSMAYKIFTDPAFKK